MSNDVVDIDVDLSDKAEDVFDDRPVMVGVEHVSMVFNMANQQLNSLKEYAIALARRELMFKEFKALDDVSFTVRRGDVFGILGTNGSGKSTMLKIIAGVLEPTSGSCSVNGKIAPLIELGAGFDMELTARENIYLNGALLGYSRKFIDEHFDEIVDFAETEAFLDMPMKNYSSGMVARIAFAIATVIVPEILIVDEVLSVGDFMFQRKCEDRISELINNYGVTVLLVSHSNDQIERLCNKAIWIEKGHTKMIGSARDVCGAYRLLGGKMGTTNSVEIVADRYKNMGEDSLVDCRRTFASEDHFSVAGRISDAGWEQGDIDTLVLAAGNEQVDSLIACGLASLYDSPVLLTKNEVLSEAAIRQIERLKPKRVLVFDCHKAISECVISELEQIKGVDVEVVVISGSTSMESSHDAYLFGMNDGKQWGDTAVLSTVGICSDLITFSPYSYAAKAPVFLAEGDGVVSSEVMTELATHFTNVVILGRTCDVASETEEVLRESGLNVLRMWGNSAHEANRAIVNWIINESPCRQLFSLKDLFVASALNPFDALTVGPLAGKTGSAVFFEDTDNLDSVALAIEFVEAYRSDIEQVTFFGGGARFSDVDQRLLASCL